MAIASPTLMKEYWGRPQATAEVLKDGWLHTGDLGYFDERGNLFIAGRRKEMIVLSSGKSVTVHSDGEAIRVDVEKLNNPIERARALMRIFIER